MLIIENDTDKKRCMSPYGNHTFVLTKEEVLALLKGEVLGDPDFDEYGTFITMTHKIDNILNRFLALWATRWIKLWTKGRIFCCRSMKLLKCISTVPTMWTEDYGHVLFLLFYCDESPIFMKTRIAKYFSFKKCQNFVLC